MSCLQKSVSSSGKFDYEYGMSSAELEDVHSLVTDIGNQLKQLQVCLS